MVATDGDHGCRHVPIGKRRKYVQFTGHDTESLSAVLAAAAPSGIRLVCGAGHGIVGAEADRQPTAEIIELFGFGTTILGGCTFERRGNRSRNDPKGQIIDWN